MPANYNQDDLDRGFVVSSLWAWSRHPNFAAEQAIWVALYQWSCWETNSYLNWTGFGALSYLILFQASTWFTELVSSGKYAEYEEYQRRVSKFIPSLGTAMKGRMPEPKPAARSIDRKTVVVSKE